MPNERTDLAGARIEEARKRGDFDDLPGRHKPLDLDELPGATDEERFEALMMRSLGEVPAEVLLIRDIRARRAALAQVAAPEERKRLLAALQEKHDELRAAWKERRGRRGG